MKTFIYTLFCFGLSVLALAFIFVLVSPIIGISTLAAASVFTLSLFVTFPVLLASVSSENVDVWEMFANDTI